MCFFFQVPVDLEEFPAGKRIVSVNNFGYGGYAS